MSAFGAFIKSLPSVFETLHPSKCIFVTGNEATDLDSTICALSLSYVMQKFEGKPLIPFINCSSKAVISMRGELQGLLGNLGISVDDLIFQDRVLNKCSAEKSPVSVFLVDHNEISTTWKLANPEIVPNVVAIIDHHADSGLFQEANPRIVQVCGSNASLLLEYLHEIKNSMDDSDDLSKRLDEAGPHLASAIIMDTVNFTWRDTPMDVKWAGRILAPGQTNIVKEDLNKLAQPIMTAFEDGEIPELNFSLKDILFKDYKLYELDGKFYAISTLHTSFEQYIEKEFNGSTEAFAQCMQDIMKSHNIFLFGITLAVREKGSPTFYQQFGIFSETVDLKGLAQHVQDSGAELELIAEGNGYYLAMQNNPNVSRKQLQPFFQNYLKK